MRKIRTITIIVDSDLSDELWQQLYLEVTNYALDAACSFAALCTDDEYQVTTKEG